MTPEVIKILEPFVSGATSAEDTAQAILNLDKAAFADALGKKIHHAAREILHYAEQLQGADTPQWQASFAFEHQRSTKDLAKLAKKALKETGASS